MLSRYQSAPVNANVHLLLHPCHANANEGSVRGAESRGDALMPILRAGSLPQLHWYAAMDRAPTLPHRHHFHLVMVASVTVRAPCSVRELVAELRPIP